MKKETALNNAQKSLYAVHKSILEVCVSVYIYIYDQVRSSLNHQVLFVFFAFNKLKAIQNERRDLEQCNHYEFCGR